VRRAQLESLNLTGTTGHEYRAKLPLPWVRNRKDIYLHKKSGKQKAENSLPGVNAHNEDETLEAETKALERYVATVYLREIFKGHRLDRMFGRVRNLYVYEEPLRTRAIP
jgi:hypothetical protein